MKFGALMPRFGKAKFVAGATLALAACLAACTSDYKMIINKYGNGAMWGLTVSSTSFANGSPVPTQYTTDGQDISPQLSWTPGPEGTKSFAIAVEAPNGNHPKLHWAIWNIPANQLSIAENGGGAYPQAANYKGTIGYTGPSPDEGDPHEFFFEVFALDIPTLTLPQGASRDDFSQALEGHVLSKGEWIGTYKK